MSEFEPAFVEVLLFLLPGLVAVSIYHRLTAIPCPTPFEFVVRALIFTSLAHVLTGAVESLAYLAGQYHSFGSWTKFSSEVAGLIAATLLAFLAVVVMQNDSLVFAQLRKLRVTYERSYPSQWFSGFKHSDGWVVLHLRTGRRLFGYAGEWPSDPERGFILLQSPKWLPSAEGEEGRPLDENSGFLIAASEVRWIELLRHNPNLEKVNERTRMPSRSSDPTREEAHSGSRSRETGAAAAPAAAPTAPSEPAIDATAK